MSLALRALALCEASDAAIGAGGSKIEGMAAEGAALLSATIAACGGTVAAL